MKCFFADKTYLRWQKKFVAKMFVAEGLNSYSEDYKNLGRKF